MHILVHNKQFIWKSYLIDVHLLIVYVNKNICWIRRTDDAISAMFSAPLFADYCTTGSEEIQHYSAFICQRVHFRCNWWDEKRTKKTQFRVKGFTDHKACSLLLIFMTNKHESLAAFCWGRCLCGRRESFVRGFFVALLSPSIHSNCEAIKEATTSVMN